MKRKLSILIILIATLLFNFGCSNKSDRSTSEENSMETSNLESKNDDKNKSNEKEESNKDSSNDNANTEISEEEQQKQQNEKYIICIDPGHQSKGDMSKEPIGPGSSEQKFKVSWGTQGVSTNIPEYELTLQASKILKVDLEQMGFKVIMTRQTNDVNITNSERAIFANENNADLVIRIHADGSENSSVNGASLHIPSHDGQYTKSIYGESNKCAQVIYNEMVNSGFKVNDIYERSDLTGFNWSEVPAVLVEMGFMSNPEEDKKLAEESYQKKMMDSISSAIQSYFNNK